MISLFARVAATLAYSSVFNFSLTTKEVWQRLVLASEKDSYSAVEQVVKALVQQGLVLKKKEMLTLSVSPESLTARQRKKAVNQHKWLEVKEAVAVISQAPGILGIAVTGSVAVNNAEEESDLDFMLVTQPHMLWICRVWVIWQSWRRGKRRSFAHEEKNSWCFNLWLSEKSLVLEPGQRSLYTAYEVCQAVWVWQKTPVAKRFLQLNDWVNAYVPHFYQEVLSKVGKQSSAMSFQLSNKWENMPIRLINKSFFLLQYVYMLSHMTYEIVRYDRAFFHPRPTKRYIMWSCREQLLGLLQ